MVDRHTINKIPLENGGIVRINAVYLMSPSNDGRQERYVTFSYKGLPMQHTEKKTGMYMFMYAWEGFIEYRNPFIFSSPNDLMNGAFSCIIYTPYLLCRSQNAFNVG